ncbi:hypothetical protein BDZ91DRAFT_760765 [Kalaharituber pfeilii]|nr:hypothetical protein BDZ91DRAFT_760765 [Kalaharituber pfeilii]
MIDLKAADVLNENQESDEGVFSGIIDQGHVGTQLDWHASRFTLDSGTVPGSQRPQEMFWAPSDVPQDFIPAPPLPEYNVRFQAPVTLPAPALVDRRKLKRNEGRNDALLELYEVHEAVMAANVVCIVWFILNYYVLVPRGFQYCHPGGM